MSVLQASLEAFVTHVESTGPLLKLWAQLDRKQATFVERLILQVTDKFERELNTPNRIEIGHVCCARYSDGVYYRARVTNINELALGKVSVHFIDFGNSETVLVNDIRSLDEQALAPLIQVNEQATDFFLAGVIPLAGSWDDNSLAFIKQMVCYEDLRCMIVGNMNDRRLLKVFYHNEDLAAILIAKKIGVAISLHAQQVLIQGYYGLSSVPSQFPGFNVPPPARLLLTPPPTQPQLAMPFIPPVRMVSASQQMVVQPLIQSPVRETVKVFTSPKLEINSEHMVYVSCVEDGPLVFAVQLQATEDMLSSLMNEINTPPAVPLSQPLMPGSVCLGRFTEDQTLCRAVVSAVLDDKCKLYYVDFGISEMLPYSEIYELPQQFINVKVMAIRFALSGLKNLHINDELKAYFKDLVTEKLLLLRVVAPEGPPLKHYGELYFNGKSIFQLLLQKMKEIQHSLPTDYHLTPVLSNGTTDFVKVSFVVNLSHFYVQLTVHTEALNSVMLAIDRTCNSSSRQLDESQIKIGLPCCALYSEDGKWYRAKILSVSSNMVEVIYVDYGNTDTVPLSSLKYIDPSLVNILKPQAILCCLNHYQDNVDDDLAITFEKNTLDKILTMVVIANLESGKLLIELLDGATGIQVNLGGDEMSQETVVQHTAERQMSYSSPTENDDWQEPDNSVQEVEMSYRGKSHEKNAWKGGDKERNQRGSRFQTSYREAPPNLKGLSWRYSQGKTRFEDDGSRNDAGGGGNKPWQKKDTSNWGQDDGDRSNRGNWGNRDGDKSRSGKWRGDNGGKSWQDGEDSGSGDGHKKFRSRDEGDGGRGGGGRWNLDENGGRRKKWNDEEDGGFQKKWNDDESGGRRKKWNDNEEGGGFRKKWNNDESGGRRKKWNNDEEGGGFQKKWNDEGGGRQNKWNNNDDGRGRQRKWNDNDDDDGSRRSNWRDGNENYQKGKKFGDSSSNWRNNRSEDGSSSRKQKSWGDNENSGQNFRFQKGSKSEGTNANTWVSASVQDTEQEWEDLGSVTVTTVTKIPEACVKIGDIKMVNMVFIGSPDEFCVQITSESNKLAKIMDGIAATYGSGGGNPIPQTDLKSGTPCVARYSEDNTVYRAIIQSVGENTASVYFCDYGNKEDVSFDDIKEISSEYLKLPVQGIVCKLVAAKSQQLAWTDDEINDFVSFTDGKELQIQFVNKNNGIYEVVLEDKIEGVNVNEKFGAGTNEIATALSMTCSKASQGFTSVNVQSFTIATSDQRFSVQTFSPEFNYEVTITWFINPEQFYCQSLSSKSELSDMMNTIQSAYCSKSPINSTIEVGTPVIAKFKTDGVLYRAEVKSMSDSSSYIVQFVDYGNHDLVDKFNLWNIETRFMNLPKQANFCSLSGIKPLDSEWKTQVDKFFEAEKLNCTFHKNEDGVNFVTLTTLEGKSIADELITNGFAVASKILQAVPSDVEPVDFSLLPGQNLCAYITYVEGISKFYIQLNKMIADKIQALIGEHVQKPENMIRIGPECLTVNSLCIATPDGEQWYRGKFIDCATTTGVFVKFIDFGDGDEIPLDKLLEIPHSLAQYAEQAVECCIRCTTDAVVTPEIEDQFKAVFEATDVIISVDSVENERMFVTIFNEEGKRPELLKDLDSALTEIEPVCPLPIISKKSIVWVSHADGPYSLWLQRVNEAEILAELLERLYSFYETDQRGEKMEIIVGKLCAAKSANDEQWYRGRITEHNADEETCSVLFLDYGNSETLPVSQVKLLDASVCTPNAQAVCVSLPVICNENIDISSQLLEMVAEKEFVAYFSHKKDGIWVVDLFEKESSLSKKLLELGLIRDLDDYPFSVSESSDLQALSCYAVYVSHVESHCELWVQKAKDFDAIMNLQDDLQIISDSLQTLTTIPSVGTKCIAAFTGAWYRAVVIETNNSIVTVQFIDYGNTDDIDIKSEGLKSSPTELEHIPNYAEKCILGKANEWIFKPEASQKLEMLLLGLEDPVTLQILNEGEIKHIDIQFSDSSSALNLLVLEGLAETSSSTENGYSGAENVFVSHVNSPSSFWVQYENKTSEIEEMESRMLEAGNFPILDDGQEGELHAAEFSDGLWYRAKILKKSDEGYEVLFIDFGNSFVVTELRSLPEDLLNLPPLAKHCSFSLSANFQWPEDAKDKLTEKAAGGGTSFSIVILTDGDPAIVNLFDGDISVEEELPKLNSDVNDGVVDIISSSKPDASLCQLNSDNVIFISHVNSPSSFWVQYENKTSEIEEMESRMLEAGNFPILDEGQEGELHAAEFSDGLWYRAKILKKSDEGYEVLFIDYGNSFVVTELRCLPEDLLNLPPLAKHCSFSLSVNYQWSEDAKDILTEKAAAGGTSFNVIVLTDGDPAIVNLFDGDSSVEEELPKLSSNVNDAVNNFISSSKSNACVCHVNSLSDFWIQFEDSATLLEDISNQLVEADSFSIPEKCEINALCVSQFPEDGNWYRARILSQTEEGTEVMYVDFGNTSVTTEFRELPENLVNIPPVAKNCSLSLSEGLNAWPKSAQESFVEIVGDVSKLFEVEVICDTVPAVINLYDAGEKIQNIILKINVENKTVFNERLPIEDDTGENKKCKETSSCVNILQHSTDQSESTFEKNVDSTADETEEEFEEAVENVVNERIDQAEEQFEIEEYTEIIEKNEDLEALTETVENIIMEIEESDRLLKEEYSFKKIQKDNECAEGIKYTKENLVELGAKENDNDVNKFTCSNSDITEKTEKALEDSTGKKVLESLESVNKNESPLKLDLKDVQDYKNISGEESILSHVMESCRSELSKADEANIVTDVNSIVALSTKSVTNDISETNLQKTEHTEKLVRELNVQMKTPEKESSERTPLTPKSIPEKLNSSHGGSKDDLHSHTTSIKLKHAKERVPGSVSGSCSGAEKDEIFQNDPPTPAFSKVFKSVSSHDLLEKSRSNPSSPKLSHNERIVPGCISRGESLEEVKDHIVQSAPSTPSFSRSQRVSKSISSQDLLKNSSSSPSSPKLSDTERIVLSCVSLEETKVPQSPKMPHSKRIVPGSISRGLSCEEMVIQESAAKIVKSE